MRNLGLMMVLAVLCAASVGAQPTPEASGKTVHCRDLFQRNADGSWSPKQKVTIGAATFSPGVSLRPGVTAGGVDPAKVCDSDGTFTLK